MLRLPPLGSRQNTDAGVTFLAALNTGLMVCSRLLVLLWQCVPVTCFPLRATGHLFTRT